MQGEFVSIRLNPETAQKLNTLATQTYRSKGMTVRFVIDLGFWLLNEAPEIFWSRSLDQYKRIGGKKK